jgi:hypothetical protein
VSAWQSYVTAWGQRWWTRGGMPEPVIVRSGFGYEVRSARLPIAADHSRWFFWLRSAKQFAESIDGSLVPAKGAK